MSINPLSKDLNSIEAIVLDLDETIISFKNEYSLLLDDLLFLNINPLIIRNAIDNANNKGFSIDLFIKTIEQLGNKFFNKKTKAKIRDTFNEWLLKSVYIFNDAELFIEFWENRVPIIILTLGDQKYQQKKIRISGLDRFQSFYVTKPYSKIEKLNLILKKQYIIYVDDNINEIIEIAENNITRRIIPFWLKRNHELEDNNRKNSDYIKISSLLDINNYISINERGFYMEI